MKTTLTACLQAMLCILLSAQANAQLTENFNSRPGVTLPQVPAYLTNHCWQFVDFDTDPSNWNPGIEGDGAMISVPNSNQNIEKSIYTPILDVPGTITISFKYVFSNTNANGNTRFLRIYLTDGANNIVRLLDSMDLSGKNDNVVYNYTRTFNAVGSADYKVLLNYKQTGVATRIAIDQLSISAPLKYVNGCDTPPVAVNDNVPGSQTQPVSYGMLNNDYDSDGDAFEPYLISGPAHGTLVMNNDFTFTYTPDPNYNGTSVSFTYKVCEVGANSLCSNTATVIISLQPTTTPVSLIDFSGTYKGDGKVQISWVTTFESNSDRFEVERSFDGRSWDKAGVAGAAGNSTIRKNYSFIDDVGKNTANKKDIFYRLRQVDKNGKTAVSRILIVRVYNTQSVSTISVTPNPAKSDINVQLQLIEASMATIRIRSSAGTEVMKKVQKFAAGSHNILMEGSSRLQPGMYVLEVVINSKERMIVKLIKE